MNWEVHIRRRIAKDLARVPKKDRERILDVFRQLSFQPYEGDIEKIGGEQNTWRRRIGNFRILYEIDTLRKIVSVRDVKRRTSSTY